MSASVSQPNKGSLQVPSLNIVHHIVRFFSHTSERGITKNYEKQTTCTYIP